MAAIDKALEFLKTSGSINYASTAKKFECDETTLRRRHQGKQRARRDADSCINLVFQNNRNKILLLISVNSHCVAFRQPYP